MSEKTKIATDSGIQTRHLQRSNRGDTCIIQDTNYSAVLRTRRVMGNFRTNKKTPTTEMKIFLSKKIFSIEKEQRPDGKKGPFMNQLEIACGKIIVHQTIVVLISKLYLSPGHAPQIGY